MLLRHWVTDLLIPTKKASMWSFLLSSRKLSHQTTHLNVTNSSQDENSVSQFNLGFYQEHTLHSLIKYFSPQRVAITVAQLENIWKLFYFPVWSLTKWRNYREKLPKQQLLARFHNSRARALEQQLRNNLSLWKSPPTAASVSFKAPLNYATPVFLFRIFCEQTVLNSCRPALGFRHCDAIKGSPDTQPEPVPGAPREDAEAAASFWKG